MFDYTAFAALIKAKRGAESQQALAIRIWNDPARKGDISRYENGKAKPQEQTVQYLCTALEISEAEMGPIRNPTVSAAQLDHIPTLSRAELQNLAARFEVPGAFDMGDDQLRALLTDKADEYRTYRRTIDNLDERTSALANVKAAARDAAERLDFEEVETHLARVTEVEAEILAESIHARAENALLRHRPAEAYTLLTAAADAMAVVSPTAPAHRRNTYAKLLYDHGLRYGGPGLELAARMWDRASSLARDAGDDILSAGTQQNLAAALQTQGSRTAGTPGNALLARAVKAYEAALTIRTQDDHPLDWATTQQNLAIAQKTQGSRTAGESGNALLARAVKAYEAALTIRSREDAPQHWAETQENLAIAHLAWSRHDACADPAAHRQTALHHVENALTVYDPEHSSYYFEQATRLRDEIRAAP